LQPLCRHPASAGQFNFCLPLLRYRTGDSAALGISGGEPMLVDFSGRRPVRFRTAAGAWINNIDISHALRGLAAAQFALHQDASGAIVLKLSPDGLDEAPAAMRALGTLVGDLPVTVTMIAGDDKLLQYTSDLEGSGPGG
jgi:phenylacetate-CoA ligase